MAQLTRRHLRSLIREEYYNTARQRKPINEGIGMIALGVLAGGSLFAAAMGIQFYAFQTFMELYIVNDPEIKGALGKLGELQNQNPDMSPMEIVSMASQNDPALAAKVDELKNQYFNEYQQAGAGDYDGRY